jgi:7-carboxy-7-deazaguanine synthase
MYAVDPHEVAKLPKMTEIEIADKVLDLPEARWVTLSGGNPALFDLHELVVMLHVAGYKVAVETQGTVFRDWLRKCEVVTVSPKPPSAGNITEDHVVEKFIRQMERQDFNYRGRLVLKIVIFDDQDYEYAKDIFQLFPDYERWIQVGNPVVDVLTDRMEQGYHVGMLISRLQWLSEKLMADDSYAMLDARVTPQLHTLIWGNARGT